MNPIEDGIVIKTGPTPWPPDSRISSFKTSIIG